MPTTFVCERCETEVESGLLACPHCGHVFDTPVPDPATYQEPAPGDALPFEAVRPIPSAPTIAPDPTPVPLPKMPPPDRNGLQVGLFLAVTALACLLWLAHNGAFRPGGGYLPASLSHTSH